MLDDFDTEVQVIVKHGGRIYRPFPCRIVTTALNPQKDDLKKEILRQLAKAAQKIFKDIEHAESKAA